MELDDQWNYHHGLNQIYLSSMVLSKMSICLIFKEFGALQYRKFAYLVEELKDRCGILGVLKITNHNDVQVYNSD